MYTYAADPKKLFYSRLWCWGTFVGILAVFIGHHVVAFDGDWRLQYYIWAFLVLLQPLYIVLAELDYRKHYFAVSGATISSQTASIEIAELEEFIWQPAPFPQTDSGGCLLIARGRRVELGFRYLSDRDAIQSIRHLREFVPRALQKNWPLYCHSTALRLLNDLEQSGRTLPPPTEDERELIETQQKRQAKALAAMIVAGLGFAVLIGLLVEYSGVPHGLKWAFGIFFSAYLLLRLGLVMQRSMPERKFDESQQIWDGEAFMLDQLKPKMSLLPNTTDQRGS